MKEAPFMRGEREGTGYEVHEERVDTKGVSLLF